MRFVSNLQRTVRPRSGIAATLGACLVLVVWQTILRDSPRVHAASKYIYVANYLGNSVSVVDPTTYAIVTTIFGFSGPWGLQGRWDNSTSSYTKLYVSNYLGNSISVIDLASNTVVATVTGLSGPMGLATNPAGYFYVTNHTGNSVSKIDPNTNTIVNTIHSQDFSGPVGIAERGGWRMYVANNVANGNFGNSVTQINDFNDTILKTTYGFSGPYGVCGDYYQLLMWVTNFAGNSVSIVDVNDNIYKTIFGLSSPWSCVSNSSGTNGRVWVTNQSGNAVSVISTSSYSVVATIYGFSSPAGITRNFSSTRLYVCNYSSNSLSVVDTSTNSVITTIFGMSGPTTVFSTQ